MGSARDEMRDVVLVEESADASDRSVASAGSRRAGPGSDSPAHALARGGGPRISAERRRRSLRWVVIAASLALALVVGDAIGARRENARIADLAGLPGIIAPVDRPLTELWRSSESSLSGIGSLQGKVFEVLNRPAGGADVVARDRATGVEVWRTEASRPSVTYPADPARTANGAGYGTGCAFPESRRPSSEESAAAPVLACVAIDASVVVPQTYGETSYPTRAHLLLLDATDGAVRSSAPVPPTTTAAFFGADLLTARVEADHVQLTRYRETGPQIRWTVTSDERIGGDDAAATSTATGSDPFSAADRAAGAAPSWVSVAVSGDLVTVRAVHGEALGGLPAGGSSWVFSPEGAVLRSAHDGGALGFSQGIGVLLEGRAFSEDTIVAGREGTRVTDARTDRSFEVEGYPARPVPDDGSVDDLVLMRVAATGELAGYDLATGSRRWALPASGWGNDSVMLIDGRVIRATPEGIDSSDVRTGEAVWTTPLELGSGSSMVTDGRLVLVTQGVAGGAILAAYGLDDGRKRWESELESDVWLFEIGGGLLGWPRSGTGGLVALG